MKNSIVPHEFSAETAPVLADHPSAPVAYSGQDWGAQPPEEEAKGTGAKFKRYWAAIKRFWWLVAGLTAIGTAVGLVATRYIKPVYEAQGRIWISDEGNNGAAGPLRNSSLLPSGSWVALMKDVSVVDSVVVKKRLWYNTPTLADSAILEGIRPTQKAVEGLYTLALDQAGTHYTLSEIKRGVVEQGTIGDSIGRKAGLAWIPAPTVFANKKAVNFSIAQPQPIVIGLISRIDVVALDNSNFLTLTLTGSEKWETADLLNAWMESFVDKAAELRRRNLSLTAQVLESQRGVAESTMHSAEHALQEFRTKTSTLPSDGGTPSASSASGGASDVILSDYLRSQAEYEDLMRDRRSLEDIEAAARQGNVSAEKIMLIPSSAGAPSLMAAAKELLDKEAQLRDQSRIYQGDHPSIQVLTATIKQLKTQTIPQYAGDAARALERRADILTDKIKQDSLKLGDIPGRAIQESRLRRDLSVAENLYSSLENRFETTKLGAASTIPDVTILYKALPAASSQRNTVIMLVGGGIFGSLALGVLIALLLDMFDHRFRYPEQITDELKLDVIGAVPTVPKPEDAASDPEAMLQSVEAFRGLRMNLHHAFSSPPVMVTISSPGAGDGKSMVSSNLALSFAEAGYRTLLIDGDIRRGKLHNVFGIDRRPGLLDYLAGEVDALAVMRTAPVHGQLTVIPSGTRRHRGPELLTSARLPALLNMARSRFDVILIDSAPLAAGIDSYALGVATGNMILVMRTGVTDRRVAKAKLKLLERLPVRMLGAVVNAVAGEGLYTEYSYLYGYSPDVDTDVERKEDIPALRSVDVATK